MAKRLIVILGPTSSGKSELAVRLAKRFYGEVISADSGQVYKGMDIGTGKITSEEMRGIPHHLLDIASPKRRFTPLEVFRDKIAGSDLRRKSASPFYAHKSGGIAGPLTGFTVAQYRKLALLAINKIFRKNKVPILCGGTGFYIQAVIDGLVIPEVAPDWKLRKKLEKKSIKELYQILREIDPRRAKTIEKENPRRLIRAIEIVTKTNGPVPILKKIPLPYPVLMLGLKLSQKQLQEKIERRVEKMFKLGLEKEAKKFPKEIIGYQEWKDYFKGKINKKEVENLIITHTVQYTKRQMTWFKRDERIHWLKNYQGAENLVKKFLK